MVVTFGAALMAAGMVLDAQSDAARRPRPRNGRPMATMPTRMRFSPLTSDHAGQRRRAEGRVGLSHAGRRTAAGKRSDPGAARCYRAAGRAWRRASAADAGDGGGRGRGGSGFSSSEVTPLVVNGIMYLSTPYFRVVAIESATGKEIWTFPLPSANPSTRGVEYWPGDGKHRRRSYSGQPMASSTRSRKNRGAQRRLRHQRDCRSRILRRFCRGCRAGMA